MSKPIWHMGIADLHSGSNFALIPPDRLATGTRRKHKDWTDAKWALWLQARRNATRFWEQFLALKRRLPKMDYCYILSDNIEGHQGKSGSAALVTADIAEQRDIAVEILNRLIDSTGRPKVFGCRGTPYHVTSAGGTESDDIIYDQLHNMQAYDDVLFCETGGLIWRLQHFIARSGTPYGKQTPISKQLIQNTLATAMDKEHDADVSLFGHCLSQDTEVLTPRGWVGYADMQSDDKVMTLNRTTDALEWNPIIAKTRREGDTQLYHVKGKGLQQAITDGHTVIYKSTAKAKWLSAPMFDFKDKAVGYIPTAGNYAHTGIEMSDADIRVMAWIIAEGGMCAGNISKGYKKLNQLKIFQNTCGAAEVRRVLDAAGLEYTENIRKDAGKQLTDSTGRVYATKHDMVVFYIKSKHSKRYISWLGGKKNIPDCMMHMNRRQLDVFLEEYIKGDGHVYGGSFSGKTMSAHIFTADKDLADRLQILCVTNGYKAHISSRVKWGRPQYTLQLCRRAMQAVTPAKSISIEPYSGFTWCLTVPNGTLMIRYKGYVSITGNCHYSCGACFPSSGKYGFVLPALKARGESYGRQFNDFYDVGIAVWKQEKAGAPLQDYTKEFKIKVAYDKPTLWKG